MIKDAILNSLILFLKVRNIKFFHYNLIIVKVLFDALLVRTDVRFFAVSVLTFIHELAVMDIALNFEVKRLELSLLISIDAVIVMHFIGDHVHFEYVFELGWFVVFYFDIVGVVLSGLHLKVNEFGS
jgi:hypothetical protein